MRRRAKENPIVSTLAIVSGAALVFSILAIAKKKTSAPAAATLPLPLPTPEPPPVRVAPGGTTPSPIQSGKPGVIVGPGPFDPVSTDWKRENAPSWWPW
jgi:hypothetical protein